MHEAAASSSGWFAGLMRRPRLALILFCLVLWTPGIFSLPPLDRDESRFAQASKQMLESGDFIDIRLGMVPRYKKPAGIYWLQAATTTIADIGRAVHDRIWTYRLASLLGGIALVLLTFRLGRAIMSREAALLAAALTGSTAVLLYESSVATTDAVLAASILAAQCFFLRVYLNARHGQGAPPLWSAWVGWGALGIGILIKGPVAPAVSILTILALSAWDRDWRWLKNTHPLPGIPIMLAIVMPWLIAITVKSHGAFFSESVGHDFAGKIAGGQESHGAPPGYFLAIVTAAFWPAILFLLPALWDGFRRRLEPATRFLLAWLVPSWLMFELVPTKLPHYILPLFPAMAVLVVLWLTKPIESWNRTDKVLSWVGFVQFAAVALALPVAAVLLPGRYGGEVDAALIVGISLFVLVVLAAAVSWLRGRTLTSAFAALIAAAVLYPTLTVSFAPSLKDFWVTPRIKETLAALSRPDDPPPTLAGYVEPSTLFMLGTNTRLAKARAAADAGAAQGGLALIEEKEVPAFLARLAELEADAREVGHVDGFNYSRGKPVHIRIYRVDLQRYWAPPPPVE